VAKAKLPGHWFKGGEDTFYHLSPQQALELGLIDEIVTPPAAR
jgi:ATP-dependent protease ClpP protease subunit